LFCYGLLFSRLTVDEQFEKMKRLLDNKKE